MKHAIHCFVSGRVQGVCFRVATRQKALLLGVTGWVCNLADGRVEVYAGGNRRQLEEFRQWLAKGPDGALVVNVESNTAEYQLLEGFEIR